MNNAEFEELSQDLRQLAKKIPLNWGAVQNNSYDGEINMFNIPTYTDLENKISPFDEKIKNYFRRRWYLWQCAKCDEYLFYRNSNVIANPNPRDQTYDVMFNNNKSLAFDIKGTVIPFSLRNDIERVIENPQEMIDFFYEKQSQGVRNCYQNRLFIVHHSFVSQEREFYLRCAWKSKREIYQYYSENIENITFTSYNNECKASVIFILERIKNQVEWKIMGI